MLLITAFAVSLTVNVFCIEVSSIQGGVKKTPEILFCGCADDEFCFELRSDVYLFAFDFVYKKFYNLSRHFLYGLFNARKQPVVVPLSESTVVRNELDIFGNPFALLQSRFVQYVRQ